MVVSRTRWWRLVCGVRSGVQVWGCWAWECWMARRQVEGSGLGLGLWLELGLGGRGGVSTCTDDIMGVDLGVVL